MIEEIRASIVARARSYVGCSARPGNPGRDRYRKIICPNGPTSAVDWLCQPTHPDARESSCVPIALHLALVVELRERGLTQLQDPFDGAVPAWARAVALARAHGALCTMQTHPEGPGIGAIVHVDGPPRHWFAMVDGSHSVDGGQNDGGYQAIHLVSRQIRAGRLADGRPVVDWIDAPLLVARLLELAGKTSPAGCSVAPPAPTVEGGPFEGIDLSSANPTPNPDALRAAGIRFGYVRLALGLGSPDTRAAAHVRALRAAGCLVGGYGVPYPPRPFSRFENDATEQALELVGLHKALGLELRLWIDAEEVSSGGKPVLASGASHCATLEQYARTIQKATGHEPILYTGAWWFDRFPELAASPLLTGLDTAISDYGSKIGAPILPRGIKRALIHQYAGSDPRGRLGTIPGVAGFLDRDRLDGPIEVLRA